jgi:hypothetical protein
MPIISKEAFAELAAFHGTNCISIFLPTHRSGGAANLEQDRIHLKNELQDLHRQLAERGLAPREVEQWLEPAQALLSNGSFWRQQSDGLAIFIGKDFFQYYEVPLVFEHWTYIADHFYLSPLLPLFTHDRQFFVLTLSREEAAHFYEGDQEGLLEIEVDSLLPEEMRDVVGYDFEQKNLQQRSGSGTGASARGVVFHGQGNDRADNKDEIRQYFRAINEGLMQVLGESKAPLILAGVEYLHPIYQEVNDYKNLHPEFIRGNTEDWSTQTLHAKAWELIEPTIQDDVEASLEQFGGFLAYEKASNDWEDIIPAAINGRIDTLFVQKGVPEMYGIFEPATQTVRLDADRTLSNTALLNLTATQTFLNQGRVFYIEPDQMPSENSVMSAIFRY